MDDLMSLHAKHCELAKKFASEQIEILNNFELVADNEDPLSELKSNLQKEKDELITTVETWLEQLFMGKTSSAALEEIAKFNMTKQKRLTLKWKKMAPKRTGVQSRNKK